MTLGRALAGITALALASAPSAQGAGADRPRVALSVSPARLALTAPGSRTIKLRNDGAERVRVDVTRPKTGLEVVPVRVLLRSGESAILTLRTGWARRPEPGSHRVFVLLTARPLRGDRVNVQVRLGVRVRMVVPGRIVRRLTLGGLRVRRRRGARLMVVSVANRGNVTIPLRSSVTALLVRRGRRVARLKPRAQLLRPGARTQLALPYRGRVRGPVTAVVQVRLGPGIRVVERRYRVRL